MTANGYFQSYPTHAHHSHYTSKCGRPAKNLGDATVYVNCTFSSRPDQIGPLTESCDPQET
jgi:hypothetical protein